MSGKQRGYFDAAGVLICEVVLLTLLLKAGSLLGTVDLSHLENWLQATSPERAVTAVTRLLGIAATAWLLLSTVLYGAAALSGKRGIMARARLVTLPALRRALDAVAAASVAASAVGGTAAMASASATLRPVAALQPRKPAQPVRDLPAGGGPAVAKPATVGSAAVGRHFPHPGTLPHELPETAFLTGKLGDVPSEANGFAGLPKGTKVVVVQPGDCLSVLAERHLGDWRLDSEIEALNFGRPQPDGRSLVNDHWIYPGWVLVMPPDAVGAQVVGGVTTTARPAAPPARELQARPTLPQRAAPEPTKAVTAGRTPVRAGVRAEARLCAEDAHHDRETTERRSNHGLVAAAGVGAIAAAGIVWRLDRSRREQLHDRPKGRLIAQNRLEVQVAERRARAIASEEAMRWVDLGLRYLSGLLEQQSLDSLGPVPSVVLVRAGQCGLEVFVSPAMKRSLGWFSPTAEGTRLVLDPEVTLEDLQTLATDRWPAWPALVNLGVGEEGALLFNLEHGGSLSVEGAGERVEGALARIALELSSQPWSNEMLAGLYALGDCPLDGRLRGFQRVADEKAMDLAEKLDRISEAQQEVAGPFSLSVLRAVACEALPNVAIAFGGTPPAALQCLAEAAVPERSGIAVVGAGTYTGARWRLVIGANADASLAGLIDERPVSFDMKVNCDPEEVALLGEALGATSDREGRPEYLSSISQVPDELIDIRTDGAPQGPAALEKGRTASPVQISGQPVPERGEVEICVLGPVDVLGGDMSALEPSRRMAALALLAYMAAHDRPVSADELAGALWPLDATKDNLGGPQRKTVMNVISRARAVLGYGAGGQERLVYSPQGYRLSPDVTSDWARFEKLVANARLEIPVAATASLRKALELVRGEPFGGALSSQFFEWVASEHLDLTFGSKVVDTAEELGQLSLNLGDFETVTWAVEKGLRLEPTREEMFRLWMHALGRADQPARVDDVYRRLKVVLRQRVHPLQEPQAESREVWRSYTTAGVRTSGAYH